MAERELIELAELIERDQETIVNAMTNQVRRMSEAADLAIAERQDHYAQVFDAESKRITGALNRLNEALRQLSEARKG